MGFFSKHVLALFVALVAANAVDAYYSWPDSYASMGDIDWGKRSYDNWISPAYAYHSMADSDWGWKKRGAPSRPVAAAADADDSDSDDDAGVANTVRGPSTSSLLSRYYQQQASRYPSYLYRPYVSAARRSPKVGRDRQYGFHSMADSDWGWKKRSAPSRGVDKRHIGSLGERLLQASNSRK